MGYCGCFDAATLVPTARLLQLNASMQTITPVVEGWIREHPEQWLWLHRRWR
jgi:lauroyl/myristoyl acyltransferase